jgi:3-dehydroquinate synthetase
MAVEARYAVRIGAADPGLDEAITETLSALGLPVHIPAELPLEAIVRAMRMDKKKNATSIRLALPARIGRVELVDVDDISKVLED